MTDTRLTELRDTYQRDGFVSGVDISSESVALRHRAAMETAATRSCLQRQAAPQHRHVVQKFRPLHSRLFSQVIVNTNRKRHFVACVFPESEHFFTVHRPALYLERHYRRVTQLGHVFWVRGAQVAFRVHVQLNGANDSLIEPVLQSSCANRFVEVIASVGKNVVRLITHQVAVIVQQSGNDDPLLMAILFGQTGGL